MTRLATLVCAALLGVACTAEAGTEQAPTQTSKQNQSSGRLVLTERNHGRTVTLRLGRTGTLLVPSRLRGDVTSKGRAVLVIRIDTFAPTASRAWELRGRELGSTVVTGPRRDGSRFRITINVVAG